MEPIFSRLERSHRSSERVLSGAEETLTRDGLVQRSLALATLLENLGLRVVALHMDNRPDWVIIDLACQSAGVCLVPLPTFFSAEQLAHVLQAVPIDAVFTDQPELLAPLCAGRLQAGPEVSVGGCELLRLVSHGTVAQLPDGSGKVTFTSGSTGRPKGVCLSTGQLLLQAEALAGAVGLERPRHLCVLPLSTLLENVAGVYAPLLSGGEVIIPPLAEVGFTGSSSLDPQRFLSVLAQYQPHSLILTPQLLQLLVSAAASGWTPPPSLRFLAVGGARVPRELLEAARGAGLPAYEGYGLSECASVVSLNVPGDDLPGSCGRPLRHLDVAIESGEIRVSGNAMLGYAGEPASWGQKTIATGDLGYLDRDGFLHVDGRLKNLLISSYGRNISPEWVESELQADGTLLDCVVFGDSRPCCGALLSPRDPQASDSEIQRCVDRANDRLPDYARVRTWLRLERPLAESPELRTENGRPRRAAILAHYRDAIDALYPKTSYARTA